MVDGSRFTRTSYKYKKARIGRVMQAKDKTMSALIYAERSKMSSELIPYKDIEQMARAIVASNFFGVKTPEQAIALMLIAQAEGMHPAVAARDYNVIQGRPALKADAMLARFQSAGGSVKWECLTDEKVSATFTHPQGGSVAIDWDMTRAKAAGLASKDNYHKWPRQMLRARVISEGIRTVYPGVLSNMYTPEEVVDFDAPVTNNIESKPSKQLPPPDPDKPTVAEKTNFLKRCEASRKWLSDHNAPPELWLSVLGDNGFESPEQINSLKAMHTIADEYKRIMQTMLQEGQTIKAEPKKQQPPAGRNPDKPTAEEKISFLKLCEATKKWLTDNGQPEDVFAKVYGDEGFIMLDEINSLKTMHKIADEYNRIMRAILAEKAKREPQEAEVN